MEKISECINWHENHEKDHTDSAFLPLTAISTVSIVNLLTKLLDSPTEKRNDFHWESYGYLFLLLFYKSQILH